MYPSIEFYVDRPQWLLEHTNDFSLEFLRDMKTQCPFSVLREELLAYGSQDFMMCFDHETALGSECMLMLLTGRMFLYLLLSFEFVLASIAVL